MPHYVLVGKTRVTVNAPDSDYNSTCFTLVIDVPLAARTMETAIEEAEVYIKTHHNPYAVHGANQLQDAEVRELPDSRALDLNVITNHMRIEEDAKRAEQAKARAERVKQAEAQRRKAQRQAAKTALSANLTKAQKKALYEKLKKELDAG